MNVVAWARVSSREQREGYSIDAQTRSMREKASKHNWSIAREFNVAESAKRGADRVAFNQMFKWVKANAKRQKIDAILAHKLDRVCRNMRDAVRLQELEDACGVKLVFVENQFGPGAAGALSFNVMAAVAQYYSDNLRGEVLKGMDEKVRQGWPTGLAPYGYLNVDDKAEPVIPHPEKSRTVCRIYELYATGQYTFKSLADKLAAEGHIYRPSQPKFTRTSLSYILNNRFYIGELHRNGQVFQGQYQLLISRTTFDACQSVLHGKNRRTGKPNVIFSGGIIRCQHCGSAMTGERIRRKLKNGGVREHVYYRCANNTPDESHPKVRWREEDIEALVLQELATIQLPNSHRDWFRNAIQAAFSDTAAMAAMQTKTLRKRQSELTNMQDRLLNGYLNGAIDDATFNTKSSELKIEQETVAEQLDSADEQDQDMGQKAMALFDLSQKLPEVWQRSNSSQKRQLLQCVSLNRQISGVSLCMTKRKPFDFLTERPFLKKSRGERIRTSDLTPPRRAL